MIGERTPSWLFPVLALPLLLAACSPSKDCRYAEWACAPGFQCVKAEGGSWGCAPNASLSPPGQPPFKPPSLEAMPSKAPPPPRAPGPCTGRPPCRKDAMECTCDGEDRLLTTVFDLDKDGKKDECARYSYPGPARKIIEVDQRCDGAVDVVHTQQADGEGNLVAWDTEQKARPEKSVYRRFVYANKMLVATESSLGAPDKVVQRCEYKPPCPPPIPNPQCKPICKNLGQAMEKPGGG